MEDAYLVPKRNNEQGIVYLDQEKCVGCHRCISVCPVRLANCATKGANDRVIVDLHSEYCIDCGRCIRHCDKKARKYRDDTEEFMNDLQAGKRISIVFAPALKTNYPDYKRILGFFRRYNVGSIYDTSFGAEITTWAYLKFITESGADGWISQPCPVVVNAIEKYLPKLLSKLVPIHSPSMCTVMYMRRYMGITDDIVFLSPCIGKKDEFKRYGEVKYNVTYKSLMQYLQDRGIDYRQSPESTEDSPPGELGSFYPSPGGLRQNVEFHTNNAAWVRQIEGSGELLKYFAQYQNRLTSGKALPLLVDVLNCMRGCNDGTGTDKVIKSDDVEYEVHKMHESASKSKKVTRKKYHHFVTFDKLLKLDDFKCSYKNQNLDILPPSRAAIEQAFRHMLKNTEESRDINCKSCGYDSCAEMAEMIARGVNSAENCVMYAKNLIAVENEKLEQYNERRAQHTTNLKEGVQGISESLNALHEGSQRQQQAVSSILDAVDQVSTDTENLHGLINQITGDMGRYLVLTKDIVNVSEQTNLLSLNASVEAARAGQHGKGFAVVAQEVRSLAQKAKQSAQSSSEINDSVQPLLNQMSAISDEFVKVIENLNTSVRDISEEISTTVAKAEEISNLSQSIISEAIAE